ncbi:hypothetical protein B0H16DRAFT_1530683 [Mycena metata]|uniref:ORC1/DEAH AAA+ ATPase domain-containing protein n=1 Tax=Mycena metata TaxID=1033252 RepID=A0AAD7JCA1_9AGAR|nr:hypothetical protein B0H16DRAFT_1530683 [Mycena metata]
MRGTRSDDIIQYIKTVLEILDESHATELPLVSTVARITLLLIEAVDGVKSNRERWAHILERVHQLLCVLATICSAATVAALPPTTLDAIGRLAQNLQKIHSCLRAQRELGAFKRFFKQAEILEQLDSCEVDMQDILRLFKSMSDTGLLNMLEKFDSDAEKCQTELLELVDRSNTSDVASIQDIHLQRHSTSSLLSLLPPPPQIFHGREAELEAVSLALLGDSPRVAIIGPGGIGKTTLATAILHSEVVAKYTNRYFVQCETSHSAKDLMYVLGSHLGLEPSKALSQDIYEHLRTQVTPHAKTLLAFDNLENSWEPKTSRRGVEEFLSTLADIAGVAILITMRGAERPASINWSRPFLPQLKPLTTHAARQIFIDIADDPVGDVEATALDGLLEATGNVPLAISLMANVASYEGYIVALSRWDIERTELISEGMDKRSNLEKSILVSLNSPRLSTTPHAHQLLGLLSMLPDGTSEVELQCGIPIPDILRTKSLLLGTSLAYRDYDGRTKVLAPIREYMNAHSPPPKAIIRPMRIYLYEMLRTWDQRRSLSSNSFVPRLAANLGNIHSLVTAGLAAEDDELRQSILAALTLDRFTIVTARGGTGLLERLPAILEHITDDALHGRYLRSLFSSYPRLIPPQDVDRLSTKGIEHFEKSQDRVGQAAFYTALGRYHFQVGNVQTALEFTTRGLALAEQTGDIAEQYSAVFGLCFLHAMSGDPRKAYAYSLQGQRIGRLRGDFPAEAECMAHEAFYHIRCGRFSTAVELCVQGRELLRACGLELGQHGLLLLDMQARAYLGQSRYVEARELYHLMISSSSKSKAPNYHAASLASLAFCDILFGADELGIIRDIEDARMTSTHISWPRGVRICEVTMSELHLRRAECETARQLLEKCLAQSRGSDPETFMACLQRLSDINAGMDDSEDVLRWAVVFFAFAKTIEDVPATYQALGFIGDGFLHNGDDLTAKAIFHTVLDATTVMNIDRSRGECMSRLGNISLRRGDVQGARHFWTSARPLLIATFQRKEVEQIDLCLGSVTEIPD